MKVFALLAILEETVQQETQGIQFDSPSINLPTSDLTRSKDYTISTDPYLWDLNEVTRDFITVNSTPQNINADFDKSRNVHSDKTRFRSTKLFKRIMKNGEVKPRAWLICSETKGSVFCAPCLLFGNNNETNAFTGEGFRDWKNSKTRVEGHENSSIHKTCVSQLKTRVTARGRIDQFLAQQLDEEISYWKNILHRVVAIVKSLLIRGLPFRGHSEQLGNPHNADHLKTFAHPGSGSTSYLSKTIYEEIKLLIHNQVLKQISTEMQNAKYFGIINDFDVMNCRGQSYDNASDMSGIYSGVQARIKTLNPLADYAPCAAHSLNLVGTCAAESVPETRTNRNPKSLSKTRWSARHDACYALEKEWSDILDALNYIATSTDQKPNTRSEAIGLQKNKKLQQSQIDLSTVVELYDSLASFLQDMRNNQFSYYEEKAKLLSEVRNHYAHDTRRKKIRKLQSDESRVNEREPYSGHENFRTNIYYRILDILNVELIRRKEVYKQLHDNFSFFDNLPDININQLTELTAKAVATYPDDLEEALNNECIHLQCYLKQLSSKV
ncbi:uncharacterized protein LOC128667613 [Microplitis demolitor]|uniref:uncharacterized protein LOC128667613 n=1 Tax=Microplitis demolitor TaxID=69319 RepID=UPI00235B5DDC|nr:uncharacterized protein LOC128667613 [Microplitis demolitor]